MAACPGPGQVPARDNLLSVAENSMEPLLGSRCRMKGMRKETEKGGRFILFLWIGMCVPVCAHMCDGCISGKMPAVPFSAEGLSGSAHSGSPGCARRVGGISVCARVEGGWAGCFLCRYFLSCLFFFPFSLPLPV